MFNDIHNVRLLFKHGNRELGNKLLKASLSYYGLAIGLNILHLPILLPCAFAFALNWLAERLLEGVNRFWRLFGLVQFVSKLDNHHGNVRREAQRWYNGLPASVRGKAEKVAK